MYNVSHDEIKNVPLNLFKKREMAFRKKDAQLLVRLCKFVYCYHIL